MRLIASIFLSLLLGHPAWSAEKKTETVILITIDGMRWQEVFRGVDNAFFDQEAFIAYKKHHADFKQDFWHADAMARRAALMPFFWNTVAREGQLYGNRDKGSVGEISNTFHFSYPGYSEILTGIADDKRITSNDKILNPNRTILEWLNDMPENNGKVAAFGSWDVFPYIINEDRAGVPVNAGFEAYEGEEQEVAFLNRLQKQVPSPWDTVRLDAFTVGFARAALASQKMKFVYIALGETDDFAHEGFYDQYIRAARRSDKAIAELWQWLQADPRYAGKTTLLITTDHGRGSDSLEAWKHHGRFPYTREDGTLAVSEFKGDGQIWMAALGPDTPAQGEVSGGPTVRLNQIAATAARLLGYRFEDSHEELEAGEAIAPMVGKQ
ncbi:alkaline phosphatase family protein [Kordiimonas aestuarii]|uniref:alkaline phosphatase family protein n=1 Tax=Kordiimonas aestuarii TaxID=1005925 RepID=UPI0021D364DA|nr:alkaline phosphatase family protein [Kordiimonas aestuarii]